jgi:hypothetical protein
MGFVNEAGWDRIARVIAGVVLFVVGLAIGGGWGTFLAVFAFVPLHNLAMDRARRSRREILVDEIEDRWRYAALVDTHQHLAGCRDPDSVIPRALEERLRVGRA